MVSTKSPTAVVGLLDQDYRYKSLVMQIPHDAGLAPICRHGDMSLEVYLQEFYYVGLINFCEEYFKKIFTVIKSMFG